ncbi:conserved hypothetical protein [Candidatus Desulfarcum epimagneticum]|uniref:Dihydropyrimidine dehydrogenase n=1 Tax=uncultured Desulfobacteraceae bacterium TaxID=218296 RepID=A0A484HFF5_9BACT|nr:conserved hypothetical protein [uncultured Desulfobacteraceae bacterium]
MSLKKFSFRQAVFEANRCLLCHDAPCSRGCPAGTDPGTFIRKLRFKNVTGAARTIKANNILGWACGALCPAARLCEKECAASGIGEPIAIAGIQRAVMEHAWAMGFNPLGTPPEKKGPAAAVLGAGPAGLACAAELARSGFPVSIFESRPEPGGAMRHAIPARRLDPALLEREIDDIRFLGADFQCGTPVEGDGAVEKLFGSGFQAVFMSPGLWEAQTLAPGMGKTPGLFSSIRFLEGLRENADPNPGQAGWEIAGKTVAVIGGGSAAMDCAVSAAQAGARDVFVIYRRSWLQMPAEAREKKEALDAGVHFLFFSRPEKYISPNGAVAGLELIRTEPEDRTDASGRRAVRDVKDSRWSLAADIVIEALGNRPGEGVKRLHPDIRMDGGLIQTDARRRTSAPGVFAGGDAASGPGLVALAVRDGKIAANAMKAYLAAS